MYENSEELKLDKQNTEEQLNRALADLERSSRPSQTADRHKKSKQTQSKKRMSSSSFERDDGENIDNIIHQILEGDDLFKKKQQSEAVLKLTVETKDSNPFELIKQATSENSTQNEIDNIIHKAMRSSIEANSEIEYSRERSRELSFSDGEQELERDNGPAQTGLDSDLETILETD